MVDIDYRPRPVTRKELFDVFENMRIVRAFEKLLELVPENSKVIRQYLIDSVSQKSGNYTTNDDDDTILMDGSSNTVTILLNPLPIENKVHIIKCIDDTFTCLVDPNGNKLDNNASTFQLYKDESIMVQSDSNNNWWIL